MNEVGAGGERPWLIVGTGAVATSILARATEAGIPVEVAGRDGRALEDLRSRFGVAGTVITDLDAVPESLLRSVRGVVVTVGPAAATAGGAAPLATRAVEVGIDHLDVSNEYDVHRAVHALDGAARVRGVRLIPGIGTGTLAAEALAADVVERAGAEDPVVGLRILLKRRAGTRTAGVSGSTAAVLGRGVVRIRSGRAVESASWTGVGRDASGSTTAAIATGDLVAVSRSAGIPDIEVLAPLPLSAPLARLALPLLRARARRTAGRATGARETKTVVEDTRTPDEIVPALRCTAVTRSGRVIRREIGAAPGSVVTGSAVVAVLEALDGSVPGGVHTAFQILGVRGSLEELGLRLYEPDSMSPT